MISGGPTWRAVGLTVLLLGGIAFVGASIDGLGFADTVIEGSVTGDVDEDVAVTIVVETNYQTKGLATREVGRESLTVNETTADPAVNESIATYSIPIDRGGEYRVKARTPETNEYGAVPSRWNRSMLRNVSVSPLGLFQTIELRDGQDAENVNFTLYDTDLLVAGELPDEVPDRVYFNATNESDDAQIFGFLDGPLLDRTWIILGIISILSLLIVQFARTTTVESIAEQPSEGDSVEVDEAISSAAVPPRPSDGGFENEVYRAWHRMSRAVGVTDPQGITPGELEREAIAAGLPPEPVHRLTELFNEARYGGTDPTDHEAEATETLQTIESSVIEKQVS